MPASSFQLLRPETWELSLSFSLSLTLRSSGFRVHLEFARVLPPHPTPLVEFLAWIFLEETLSNLSALIFARPTPPPIPPTTEVCSDSSQTDPLKIKTYHSSAGEPQGVLHIN